MKFFVSIVNAELCIHYPEVHCAHLLLSYGIESDCWLSIIRRLAFAASIYIIWQERNGKVFRNNKRSCDDLFKTTVEMIKNKLSGIIVKDSAAVKEIKVKWDISCQRETLKNSMGSVAASSNAYV
ncbi:hypothetical protein Tco_0312676 [Tanacetum coccineum]